MILRRLSQSLKEQNWTAIWIEFILLILGVFLGIQVANWNEDRIDRKREQDFLERLLIDIENDQIINMLLGEMQAVDAGGCAIDNITTLS